MARQCGAELIQINVSSAGWKMIEIKAGESRKQGEPPWKAQSGFQKT
jgi:hypothetical protein